MRDWLVVPARRADPGAAAVARACSNWLRDAQDHSRSRDGGVSRHYSLIDGWGESYPETTGYIIPTMLDWARASGERDFLIRAKRMLDWLVSIQLDEGAFQGGTIAQEPVRAVTFNTGQVVLGLAAGAREWPEYLEPLNRAATWLCRTQDPDGAWRRHPSPFVRPGDKTYDTHVAWGLFEAARVASDRRYLESGLANVRWALKHQTDQGWFSSCCLNDPSRPLTHTIGYALRGTVEAFRACGDPMFLDAALRCADGLAAAVSRTGRLPGRLDHRWRGAVSWCCLTGTVQVALCWMLLDQLTGQLRYQSTAARALAYTRRTVDLLGPIGIRGGVKGSFPVSGAYGKWQYLSWAAKFLVDASLLEMELPLPGTRGALKDSV